MIKLFGLNQIDDATLRREATGVALALGHSAARKRRKLALKTGDVTLIATPLARGARVVVVTPTPAGLYNYSSGDTTFPQLAQWVATSAPKGVPAQSVSRRDLARKAAAAGMDYEAAIISRAVVTERQADYFSSPRVSATVVRDGTEYTLLRTPLVWRDGNLLKGFAYSDPVDPRTGSASWAYFEGTVVLADLTFPSEYYNQNCLPALTVRFDVPAQSAAIQHTTAGVRCGAATINPLVIGELTVTDTSATLTDVDVVWGQEGFDIETAAARIITRDEQRFVEITVTASAQATLAVIDTDLTTVLSGLEGARYLWDSQLTSRYGEIYPLSFVVSPQNVPLAYFSITGHAVTGEFEYPINNFGGTATFYTERWTHEGNFVVYANGVTREVTGVGGVSQRTTTRKYSPTIIEGETNITTIPLMDYGETSEGAAWQDAPPFSRPEGQLTPDGVYYNGLYRGVERNSYTPAESGDTFQYTAARITNTTNNVWDLPVSAAVTTTPVSGFEFDGVGHSVYLGSTTVRQEFVDPEFDGELIYSTIFEVGSSAHRMTAVALPVMIPGTYDAVLIVATNKTRAEARLLIHPTLATALAIGGIATGSVAFLAGFVHTAVDNEITRHENNPDQRMRTRLLKLRRYLDAVLAFWGSDEASDSEKQRLLRPSLLRVAADLLTEPANTNFGLTPTWVYCAAGLVQGGMARMLFASQEPVSWWNNRAAAARAAKRYALEYTSAGTLQRLDEAKNDYEINTSYPE